MFVLLCILWGCIQPIYMWNAQVYGQSKLEQTPHQETSNADCGALSAEGAVPRAVYFYENHGIWSGIFSMVKTHKKRIVQKTPTVATLHLRYTFYPVPNNPKRRTNVGQDQRTFRFVCTDGKWGVVSMGGFMSATEVGE